MNTAKAQAGTPSRRPPLQSDDMADFLNGYFSPKPWLFEHLAATNAETRQQCHDIIFADNVDFGAHTRQDRAKSCRKLSGDDSEEGERNGLVMALVHDRYRGGHHDKTLPEVARDVVEYRNFYFLLVA